MITPGVVLREALGAHGGWAADQPTGVLFVCLGNICRSPLAKALFDDRARARGVYERFFVDSCGTGHWHVGRPADARSIAISGQRGASLTVDSHRARQVDPAADFGRFHLVLAMDRSNAANLRALGADARHVVPLRVFDPTLAGARSALAPGFADDPTYEVPDPYHGGPEGFAEMHDMLLRACDGLLDAFEDVW